MDLKITALPGEALVVAILNAVTVNRETMSQENRDKFDALFLASMERGDKFWGLITGPLVRALERLNASD